ncbi:L-seryl-tRNA(Sec) selenium transferase [Rossellomorea sp. SC111]|uniref:L-seryl-tRNA(Sec) selenium transferase n=1 Tax=Rossellomorea sp. SC111 TaxID=2968985 RepID=UPI00215B44C7|nr:L-seryl-tRNA(Sec) selenium transferase [Rossellomorea sp. SC111]MCR8847384.1 L-seryl-tRNA(Sec) selenium transferase [Rossellomorea sp. SC111]
MNHLLRHIPSIHELQQTNQFHTFLHHHNLSMERGTDLLKKVISICRASMLNKEWNGPHPSSRDFIDEVFGQTGVLARKSHSMSLRRIINATGTILHTNLGRARLGQETMNHIMGISCHYSNLEYDIDEGVRGSRHSHAENLICELTGAEAAMVVNNNAAAVFLILTALAKQKEVIVSRGELVEIGGSFRISSIMEESGALLHEVGTTNKTHLRDYDEAMSDETRMIMKVHQSNFVMKGFTASVPTEELAGLSRLHSNVHYYEDLGSGALYDFTRLGIGDEPLVKSVLDKGADLVSFSGDKLLGGPQAGIIAGQKDLIDQLKKHQLARVLRVDKMTLAALEMTLLHYRKGEEQEKNPTIRAITRTKEEILHQSRKFVEGVQELGNGYSSTIVEGQSQIGGGTMPDVELNTYIVAVSHSLFSSQDIHEKLRKGTTSILTRIQDNVALFDLRTVSMDEQREILHVLKSIQGAD